MNTKKAIDFIENELKIHKEIYEAFGIPEMAKEKSDIKNAITTYQEIISLFQQGEKYRQMWEELKESNSPIILNYIKTHNDISAIAKQAKILRNILMDTIKQKYFPKETNDTIPE